MAGYVFMGTLAAFGLICGVWVCCGFFLPDCRAGAAVIAGPLEGRTLSTVRRWIWLREMGLLYSPLIAVEETVSEAEREWLSCHGFILCSRGEVLRRLGIGEIEH